MDVWLIFPKELYFSDKSPTKYISNLFFDIDFDDPSLGTSHILPSSEVIYWIPAKRSCSPCINSKNNHTEAFLHLLINYTWRIICIKKCRLDTLSFGKESFLKLSLGYSMSKNFSFTTKKWTIIQNQLLNIVFEQISQSLVNKDW